MSYFFLLFLVLVTLAEECELLDKVRPDLSFPSFSAEELKAILTSACTEKSPPRLSEIITFNKGHDDSALLDAYDKLTKGKALDECGNVLCSMEKIWGKELGNKILYIKLKYGFNSSELAFDNASRFKVDELDHILLALGDIPSHLLPVTTGNQQLTHFTRGSRPPGVYPDQNADSTIIIYDFWTKARNSTPAKKRKVIFHEITHNIGHRSQMVHTSREWLSLSGWVNTGNRENERWIRSGEGCFASGYGKNDPYEDFAEAVTAYRYNLADFKNRCPEKYQFIKDKIFKGAEYDSRQSCSNLR